MSKTHLTSCSFCSAEFSVETKETKRGNGKFCSKVCFYASIKGSKKINRVKCVCSNPLCNKEFEILESVLRKGGSKSGLRFCTRKCKDNAQSIKTGVAEIQPAHYKNGTTNYRAIAEKHFGLLRCNRCNFDSRPEILQVHHKDRDRTNNNPSNLEVLCPNCHTTDHYDNHDGLYSGSVEK